MADIGLPVRKIDVVPEPVTQPVREPAPPKPRKVPVPGTVKT